MEEQNIGEKKRNIELAEEYKTLIDTIRSPVSHFSTRTRFSKPHKKAWLSITVLSFIFILLFYIISPKDFPTGKIISVEEGATLKGITNYLKEEKVIDSPFFFKLAVIGLGGASQLKAGDYVFDYPTGVVPVAVRILTGISGIENFRVTIPEGISSRQIGDFFSTEKFSKLDKERLFILAEQNEGYLFPDTYYFPQNVSAERVVSAMRTNFERKTADLKKLVLANEEKSKRYFEDIIIMASLLEKEARLLKTRQIISGILWKRLDEEMLLQVDAVFPYIIGKNTFEVSLEDLEVDSPYNTYEYKGLPIGPITNPGLEAIYAAINPIENPYYFYLSDYLGEMHYAEDFEEHVINKRLYLR